MHQKTSDRWPRCPAKCFVPEFDEALALRIGSPFASSTLRDDVLGGRPAALDGRREARGERREARRIQKVKETQLNGPIKLKTSDQ